MGGKGVDSVETVNAFLAMIGGAPVPNDHFERPVPVSQAQPIHSQQEHAEDTKSLPSSGENTTNPASPTTGTRAPPTTPATVATALEKVITKELDPIEEHSPEIFAKLADPGSTLYDSKHARPQRRVYNNHPSQPGTTHIPVRSEATSSFNRLDFSDAKPVLTKVQEGTTDRIAQCKSRVQTASSGPENISPAKFSTPPTSNFEDDVLTKFKARAEAKKKDKDDVKVADKTEAFPTFEECLSEFNANTGLKTPNRYTNKGSVFLTSTTDSLSPDAVEFVPSSPSAVQYTPDKKTEAVAAVHFPPKKMIEAVAPVKSPQTILNEAKAELVTKTGRLSISDKEFGWPEAPAVIITTSSEDAADGENATHFTSRGTPQARSTTRACVRKVILRGLPANADLTLVQSLIHGGAIDTYEIGVDGTANVTFTTAEACDAYYAKYPNGITVKYKGNSYVVDVEKGADVNVISGLLQGQLECGASRCVRAVGADHGWGMAALIKLAEGKTRKGKVEHIGEAWRNEVRTIIFRFTSIGDAVTFKATLLSDEDWETCSIQFMDDPCEKATKIHLE